MGDDSILSLDFAQNPIATITETSLAVRNKGAIVTNAQTRFSKKLHGRSLPGFAALKTIDDLVASLAALDISGPLTLYSRFNEQDRLGQGAQFLVTSGDVLYSENCAEEVNFLVVAVKRPLFNFGEDGSLDLTSPKSWQQIHDMYLEVVALRHKALRSHRNIVRLLGWALDGSWYQMPLLVLELAFADLRTVFEKTQLGYDAIHQLGIDVGQGLDAIHGAGIVHGDLKPQNVLVFQNDSARVPFVAKLADFGLSMDDDKATAGDLVDVIGMSSEWCAPEIYHGVKFVPSQLIKADNFSYGMVLWSISCLEGQSPPSKHVQQALKSVECCEGLSNDLASQVAGALSFLLHESAVDRPLRVGGLLKDDSVAGNLWIEDEQNRVEEPEPKPSDQPGWCSWEPVSITPFFFQGLEASYRRYKATLTGPELLSIFLALTYKSYGRSNQALQIEVLQAAVNKRCLPAQAIFGKVCELYDMPCETNRGLLQEAATTGSLFAWNELNNICPHQAERSWAKFRGKQGYNQFFSPARALDAPEVGDVDAEENSPLHVMAAHGAYSRLEWALRASTTTMPIDGRNRHGETALYKACLVGCRHSVLVLCQHGADASIPTARNQLTCLHWLFNFPTDQIEGVLTALLKAKANINALADPVPWIANFHFPFSWPSGSPLHWAVFTACHTAVTGLLRQGADPTVRDSRDPYMADENVRQMHCHGNPEIGEFSEPDHEPLGFSVLDLATALHDAQSIRLIRQFSTTQVLLGEDEEGYTPCHRLSFLLMSRASNGLRFWYPAFAGAPAARANRMIETIEELQNMGANINQLTRTPTTPGRSGVSGLSPLMIATTESDHVTATALLHCGADPNMVNRDDRSPLTLIPDGSYDPHGLFETVKMLVKHGGNVNHRSRNDTTPLMAAIWNGELSLIRHLIESGAQINVAVQGVSLMAQLVLYKSHERSLGGGATVSQTEAVAQDVYFAELVHSCGPHVRVWSAVVDKDNGSLLHYAAKSGLVRCVETLVAAGLDVNQVRKSHFSDRPSALYSSIWRYMSDGTPLDAVDREIDLLIRIRRPLLSTTDARFVMDQYEAVKRVLTTHGAVKSDELAG